MKKKSPEKKRDMKKKGAILASRVEPHSKKIKPADGRSRRIEARREFQQGIDSGE